MRDYIKLMRPHHYIKNFLIFLPIFFSGELFHRDKMWKTILCFFAFCILSSFVYVINDIKDVEKDRNHPKKRNRPIASGKIYVPAATGFSVVLLALSFGICIAFQLGKGVFFVMSLYLINNLLYSLAGMKDVSLVDICSIVLGFCLRMFAGSVAGSILISKWLYLVVISGSFYLAIGKRLKEKIQMEKQNGEKRKVLDQYPAGFLEKSMYMCMSLMIVFYTFWCIDESTSLYLNGNLIWTVPVIIILALRYTMDVERAEEGDPTTVILKDKILLCCGGLLGVLMFVGVYML